MVNFVSRHAVFYSRMLCGMGRNVQFYCERFGTSLCDAVTLVKERKLLADEEIIWRALIRSWLWFEMECVVCSQMSFSGTMCLL